MIWLVIILVVWLLARSAADGAIRRRPSAILPPAVVIEVVPDSVSRRASPSHPRVVLQGHSAWVIGSFQDRDETV